MPWCSGNENMKNSKRILLLGGNHVQMTAIKAALNEGYYVITADYLPDNPGHKLANEYHNISTIDKEAILKLAIEKNINGIVSYASDVSACTAAYVAEKMGLPTNPYKSVDILTDKQKFRDFLMHNGFPTSEGRSFDDYEEAKLYYEQLNKPVIIKPTDSSGSKGVSKLNMGDPFGVAWNEALKYSRSGVVRIERFIEKIGYQIDGDVFMEDGRIVFWGICDQHHDMPLAPYVPAGLSYPSIQPLKYQNAAREQLEKILHLLGMKMGGFNVEYVVGKDEQIYFLEIGPRCGGNLIPDTIEAATGFEMAGNAVRQAVGDDVSYCQSSLNNCCSSYIIHAQESGVLKEIVYADEVKTRIVKEVLYAGFGDHVNRFVNGGCGIGGLVLMFENTEQMCNTLDNMNEYVKVVVEAE